MLKKFVFALIAIIILLTGAAGCGLVGVPGKLPGVSKGPETGATKGPETNTPKESGSHDPEKPGPGVEQEKPKISVGTVKVISGGEEYEPRMDGICGLSNGIFWDAVRIEPQDIADELVVVPLNDDLEIIIEGGIQGGTTAYILYGFVDGEWVKVSEYYENLPEYMEDAIESGEYIMSVYVTWENGMVGNDQEYLGVMYSFKIIDYSPKIDYAVIYNVQIAEWKSALGNYKNGVYPGTDVFMFDFYSMSGYGAGSDSVRAYYAFYDIDGNGTMELILRRENASEDIISYIFTINNEAIISIFGYDEKAIPREVPWSRIGSSMILKNGFIDSTNGNYTIYEINDDGCSVNELASEEPYDYPDQASLASAKWRYYINGKLVEYGYYVNYLKERGYKVAGNNALAEIDWISIG